MSIAIFRKLVSVQQYVHRQRRQSIQLYSYNGSEQRQSRARKISEHTALCQKHHLPSYSHFLQKKCSYSLLNGSENHYDRRNDFYD